MAVETTIIPSARQVIYDAYANFPSAGLAKGDLAWATDRLCLYRWSGSAWQAIGISSRHGDVADIGDPADYPESSLYQAEDQDLLYMVVSGAWTQITAEAGLPLFAAGEFLIISLDIQRNLHDEDTYKKVKEIQIASGGTVRVSFDMDAESSSYFVYGRVYKNGVAHGTERSQESTVNTTYTEDLQFEAGDLVQLYGKTESPACDVYLSNFRLKSTGPHLHAVTFDEGE